jgi:hypothetical protein
MVITWMENNNNQTCQTARWSGIGPGHGCGHASWAETHFMVLSVIATSRHTSTLRDFYRSQGLISRTYAPIAFIVSICMLYSIAASLDWEIHIIDIDLAFLNSEMPLDQPTYAWQPLGYVVKRQ